METSRAVFDEVLRRINHAAALARSGKAQEALVAYEAVFEPLSSGESIPQPPMLRVDMTSRRSNLLEKLGRREEALALLDDLDLREAIREDPKARYELAIARAHTLGRSDAIDEMLHAFSHALQIVEEELGGEAKLRFEVVHGLLDSIQATQSWQLLLDTARQFVAYGRDRVDNLVVMEASWHVPFGYRGLGEIDKARVHARAILESMHRHGQEEGIKVWKEFLSTLG